MPSILCISPPIGSDLPMAVTFTTVKLPICRKMATAMASERPRAIFMGSPVFAVPSLMALVDAGYALAAVYTQPDRPAGRGRKLVPPPVKLAAEERGIAVQQPLSLRSAESTEELRRLAPDLIVVVAYGQILRRSVIDLPRFGCLNVHASLLPRHRGASAVAAAILAGDAVTGITIMKIDPGLDTGPVLKQRSTPVDDADTTGSLTERLSRIGASLLIDTLPGWLAGEISAMPQDDRGATLAPLLTKEAGVIDWLKPAIEICREVRAYNPWPLSTSTLDGERIQFLEAMASPAGVGANEAPPGTVLALNAMPNEPSRELRRRTAFVVATGNGLFVPLSLRRAGRTTASGAEFARGARGLVGSRFE